MKKIFAIVLAIAAMICARAQSPQSVYEACTYINAASDTLLYRLLRPETVETGKKYPLILFMHGAGERGADNERQLIHGAKVWLNPVNRLDYPAYVLIPQCPESGYWAFDERPASFVPDSMPANPPETAIIARVMALVDQVASMPEVDRDRIYVMGLSMGGMATYDLAVRYPDVFAAAVPICGTVNPSRLDAAKDVAFRIYHGGNDTTVPVEGSREAYRKLRSLGADVTYVEFPGVGHGSWYPAFTDSEFMTWLFSQHK